MLWPLSPTTGEGPATPGGGEEWGGLLGGEQPFPLGKPSTSLSRCGLAEGWREKQWLGPRPRPWGLDPLAPEPPTRPLVGQTCSVLQGLIFPSPPLPAYLFLPQTFSFILQAGLILRPLPSLLTLVPFGAFCHFTSSNSHTHMCQHTHIHKLPCTCANICIRVPTGFAYTCMHVCILAHAMALHTHTYLYTHACMHTLCTSASTPAWVPWGASILTGSSPGEV